MKRTKIVATIGPASEKPKVIQNMVRAGLNVARLNFSHNVHSHHLMLIKNIRQVVKELDIPVTILQDLQGPRIRIGDVGEKGIKIKKGKEVILLYSLGSANLKTKPAVIPMHYKDLHRDLKIGERVLVEDGLIQMEVKRIKDKKIYCEVLVPGVIKTHKGMNFPDSDIKAKALTKKDLSDLAFGIKNDVDFVALSFVRDEKDIIDLRKKIMTLERKFKKLPKGAKVPVTKIIAKIERREAVDAFDEILEVVDGIMVARGDLGIELPFEDVPLAQKAIIKKCNQAGKPVIVATQMLDSMIRNPLPTRAEVSDVANAILDGTDAIMLSGESATGKYPLKAVKAMKRIATEVEPVEFKMAQKLEAEVRSSKSLEDISSFNVQNVAEQLGANMMVCLTGSGKMARNIVRYKSRVPLLAITDNKKIKSQLNLSWGTLAWHINFGLGYKKLMAKVVKQLKKQKQITVGDTVVFCADESFDYFKSDGFVKIEEV